MGILGSYWGIMEKKMETTIMGYIGIIGYLGGCQKYGPFLGSYYNTAPNIQGTQQGIIIYHNFDNHPFAVFTSQRVHVPND